MRNNVPVYINGYPWKLKLRYNCQNSVAQHFLSRIGALVNSPEWKPENPHSQQYFPAIQTYLKRVPSVIF